ncbi:hypothetical protein [Treponema sp.]|uniref:hypothetical protein n=1 Tax=Treponema sp. TaxID=166 RepID=UPI003F00D100
MEKKEIYLYIPLSFAFLLPVPGRFAFGLVMIIELYLMSVCEILFKKLTLKFFNRELHNVITMIVLVSMCILFRQFMILFSPLVAFVMGIAFFMPALTSFVMGSWYSDSVLPLPQELCAALKKCSMFSVFAAVFFLIRDIFGYGTVSFPYPGGVFEIQLFGMKDSFFLFSFLASIPGAVVLLLLFSAVFFKAVSVFEIIETSRVD